MSGRRRAVSVVALCVAATIAALPAVALAVDSNATEIGASGPAKLHAVPGQVVVKLAQEVTRAQVSLPTTEEVRTRFGAVAARTLLHDRGAWSERVAAARRRHPERSRRVPVAGTLPDLSAVYVLTVPPGRDVGDFCRAARLDPTVEYCQPDRIAETLLVPNDPYFSSSGSWGQSFADQWGLDLIGAESAWDVSTGAGALVAVIDTGVSSAPDLKFGVQLWRNPAERHGMRGVDDDGNGYVDDLYGWSFVTCEAISDTCLTAAVPGGSQRAIKDRFGHGTAVSSVIAAAGNNKRGMVGLAFGAQVMAVRGLNANGQGVASELAAAILYAAENGADVINMSWGFSYVPGVPFPQVVVDAIAVARGLGVVLVAAAGNDGVELDPRQAVLPAGLPGVIAVSASNPSDQLTSFSTFGSWVDLAAPGGGPEDTFPPSGTDPLDGILTIGAPSSLLYRFFRLTRSVDIVKHGYMRLAGTSFSSPHVAAAAALILSHHPEFTADEVEQVLRQTAVDMADPGRDVQSGYGRIDVARAITVDSMPIARLAAPAYGTRLRAPVDVIGTAHSPSRQLASWRVLLGPAGGTLTEIASGTTDVQDGFLATIDPATLPLGQTHTLRLEVADTTGSQATDTLPFTPLPPPPVPPITFHKVFDSGSFVGDQNGEPLWDAIVDDLDGDGRQEIIFCTCPSYAECPTVHVWENTGNDAYAEVFAAPIPNPYVGAYAWRLTTGDIDGDGHKELLIADAAAYVHVLKNVGDNAYQVQADVEAQINLYFSNHRIWGMFVADTNVNGKPEVVLVMEETGSSGTQGFSDLYVFEHTGPVGQSGFQLIFSQFFQPSPLGLTSLWWSALGDSDNDGIPDIVLGTLLGGPFHGVDRFEWSPVLATYEHKVVFPAFPVHGGLPVVADVDGDGQNELLYSTAVGSAATLVVYESAGDDTYAESFQETETLHRGLNLAVTTLPGTSLPVIVMPGYGEGGTGPGLLYAFAPTGLAGDYANLTPAPIAIPNYVHGVAAGDFDGDGKLDVLIANEGQDGTPPAVAVYEQE